MQDVRPARSEAIEHGVQQMSFLAQETRALDKRFAFGSRKAGRIVRVGKALHSQEWSTVANVSKYQ